MTHLTAGRLFPDPAAAAGASGQCSAHRGAGPHVAPLSTAVLAALEHLVAGAPACRRCILAAEARMRHLLSYKA